MQLGMFSALEETKGERERGGEERGRGRENERGKEGERDGGERRGGRERGAREKHSIPRLFSIQEIKLSQIIFTYFKDTLSEYTCGPPPPLKHPRCVRVVCVCVCVGGGGLVPGRSIRPLYLLLQPLHLGGHALVALVLVAGAKPAHEHPALAAVELLQVLVLRADLLRQVGGGRDQLVRLQGLLGGVGLQVRGAERAHARQAALDRRPLRPLAHVARHLRRGEGGGGGGRGGGLPFGSGRGASVAHGLPHVGRAGPFAELLHGLGQHGVPGQGGLGVEGLPALGAAVAPLGVLLAPVVLDAAHAVAVAAGDGGRVVGEVQTHRAVELLLGPQFGAHGGVRR